METIENEKGDKILKNMTASIQREYIAGEVSKDLTKKNVITRKNRKRHIKMEFYIFMTQNIFTTNLQE